MKWREPIFMPMIMYKINYTKNLHYLIIFILFVAFLGFDHKLLENSQLSEVSASTLAVDPLPSSLPGQVKQLGSGEGESTVTLTPTPSLELIKESHSIEEIAEEVFNDDANLMLAIGKAESGLDPNKCHIDENEYSCGWLQINLRAHFDKVPGETFEEKAEYLKDSKHNALVGRFIKATSGLRAWSVYTNGSYEDFLE